MREKTIKLVWTSDDAIAFDAITESDMLDYIRTRDMSALRFRDGARPTVFECAWIANDVFDRLVMTQTDPYPRARMCFRLGVRSVSKPNGEAWAPSGTTKGRNGSHAFMTDEEADLFSPAEIEEIGTALYYHSFLPLRIDRVWRVPPSSLDILTRQTYRSADDTPASAEVTSAEPSPPSTLSTDETPSQSAEDASASKQATAVNVVARG